MKTTENSRPLVAGSKAPEPPQPTKEKEGSNTKEPARNHQRPGEYLTR